MMAELWSDVGDDLASAKRHFGNAVHLFKSEQFRAGSAPDYLPEMAFLHAMQSGYTSFEAALKRVFALLDEKLPVGSGSHSALLRRANRPIEGSRPAILDETLFLAANELHRFRHVAIHTYDHFDAVLAGAAVSAAETFLAEVDPAIAGFRAVIDPD